MPLKGKLPVFRRTIPFIIQKLRWVILLVMGCLTIIAPAFEVQAQAACGIVSSIAFPVDRSVFQIAQDFGVPSPRHQGKYHTGEDYYGGRNASYGQPVRAIADGRVTYSSGNGWGRDGGVVIIEHTFPDGSVAYSMYGHMENGDLYPFPARYDCVKGGDIIGMVGNARPAPHLHLEIRTNQPDIPGPGYTPEVPTTLGWRKPSQFITNWMAWLSGAHLWHAETGNNLIAPPLELSDHSLLFLDKTRLRDLTPDGRVLWRIILPRPAVGLSLLDGTPILIDADGTIQVIGLDVTLGQSWATGVAFDSPPITAGDLLLLHSPNNTLVALSADRRSVVWQVEDVPPIVDSQAAPNLIGLITEGGDLLSVSYQGVVLDRAPLVDGGSLAAGLDGNLLAYTQDGVWSIDGSGTWTLVMAESLPGGTSNGLSQSSDGRLFLLSRSGEAATPTSTSSVLFAYAADGTSLWQIEVPDVAGDAALTQVGNVLLLTTNYGNIVALQADTGALCNATQMYGDGRSPMWHSLDDDGVLRLAVDEQILGLNWQKFIGGCA